MKRSNILIYGAGGHAVSCADLVEQARIYKLQGFIDRLRFEDERIMGYPVISNSISLEALKGYASNLLIGIGHMGNGSERSEIFEAAKKIGFQFPAIISPHSSVSGHSAVQEGVIVMHGAIINSGAVVNKNSIINTKALIEHGVKIGQNVHISTGAILNGNVEVGSGTFIGSGVVVKQGVKIGENCFVRMGSIVTEDLLSAKNK